MTLQPGNCGNEETVDKEQPGNIYLSTGWNLYLRKWMIISEVVQIVTSKNVFSELPVELVSQMKRKVWNSLVRLGNCPNSQCKGSNF